MSNINPENNDPTEDDGLSSSPIVPGNTPEGRDVIRNVALPDTRVVRQSTAFSSTKQFQHLMIDKLEQIRFINDRIAKNSDDLKGYLIRHEQQLQQVKSIQNDVKQQQDRLPPEQRTAVGSTGSVGMRTFGPEDLIPLHQQRYHEQRATIMADIARPDSAVQLEALQRAGMIDAEGRLKIGHSIINPESIATTMREIQDRSQGELATQFNQALNTSLSQQIVSEAPPEELAFARGLSRLSSGHGLFGRLSEVLHLGHGMSMRVPMARPMGAGPGSGVVADEGLYGAEDPTQLQGLAGVLSRGAARGGAVGGIARGLGTFLGGEGTLGALLPEIAPFFAAYELIRHFGSQIPIVGPLASGINRGVNERFGVQALQTGQLTGEGTGAGFAASQAAIGLTPGGRIAPTIAGYNLAGLPIVGGIYNHIGGLLHPFDPVTNQIAQEIVQSVRTQGFTGPIANQLYGQVASVYRDLGLSVQTTTEMITTAMRGGGESMNQIVTEMKTFDDAAHNLSMNINDYAASINTVASGYRAQGAGPIATQLAQSFIQGLPRNMREGAGLQEAQSIFDNFKPLIGAQLGIPQQLLMDPRNAGRAQAALGPAVMGYLASMPGRDLRQKAEYATQLPGTLLSGMNVQDILNLVNRAQAGRGMQAQGAFRQATRDYQTALAHEPGFSNVEIQHLTPAQLRQFGITRHYNQLSGTYAYLRDGFTLGPNSLYRVATVGAGAQALSDTQLRRLREAAIDQVGVGAGGLLTKAQASQLRHDILNRSQGHWINEFNQMAQKAGPNRNHFNTPFGTISVTAGPGLRKILNFNLQQNQARYGQIPTNRAFPWEGLRTAPTLP